MCPSPASGLLVAGIGSGLSGAIVRRRVLYPHKQLKGSIMRVLMLVVASSFALACITPEAPCLTGFELGLHASGATGNWKGDNIIGYGHHRKHHQEGRVRTDNTIVGGFGSLHFDTMGRCKTAARFEK